MRFRAPGGALNYRPGRGALTTEASDGANVESARSTRTTEDVLVGNVNLMAVAGLVAMLAAVMCAVVYLGSMTYTLVHYRSWYPPAAFFVSVVFAVVALLSGIPMLIAQNEIRAPAVGRLLLWATCLVLAGLQLSASVLGDATFSMASLIGITTILAVGAFEELAGHTLAEG